MFRKKHHSYFSSAASSKPPYPMNEIARVAVSPDVSDDALQHEIANAVRPFYKDQTPVIITGAASNSPAISTWKSIEYLFDRAVNNHTVTGSVELGGSYNDPEAERLELPLVEYLNYLRIFEEKYGNSSPSDDIWAPVDLPSQEILYMAQNDLPEFLKDDVFLPAFCGDNSFQVGDGKEYSTMIWIGPRGCVSPLHFDPLDNILLQLVGRKRVIVFPPQQNVPWHYAGMDGHQNNTSPIDVESSDIVAKFPLFAQAPQASHGVLGPGDAIFIPSKWWHHVRSLDMTCSVNIWWR